MTAATAPLGSIVPFPRAGHAAGTATTRGRYRGEDPLDRLRRRGIRALWTADCSATVELARLEGPELGQVTTTWARRVGLTGSGPWCVSDPCVRIALYEYCLVRGTVFDIYRWVNLRALASVWHALLVPPGVRHEWGAVLRAARLLPA